MAQSTRLLPRALSPRWLALRPKQWQIQRRGVATAAAAVKDPEPVSFSPAPSRLDTIRHAKPFSDFLTDTYAREHDYLRISLTERCNLRCLYCMPEEGIQLSPNRELLTTAEIYYLSALFVNQGVTKIRLTGGEPTVRKDIVPLMHQIGSLRKNGLKELALTTNGISLHRKLDEMVKAGLTGVNISLDTLDPFQFQLLTRRAGFSAVMKSIDRVKEMNRLGAGIKLKINCVVMRGLNDHQVLPFVDMTRAEDVEVRFIEYMPFGGNKWSENKMFSYSDMLDLIRTKYPEIGRLKDAKNDTSKTWQVPGHVGRVGFITSMTHNFCGTCNRLRITSDGNLKVCLHGEAEVSLRDLLRKDHGGDPLDEEAFEAIRQLELDHRRTRPEGEVGWMSKEQQLLEVIGRAVKRKEEGHAGMGELENMKNRPMILIDESVQSHLVSQQYHRRRSLPPPPPTTPWSKVPLHLLNPASFSSQQVRYYSDDKQSGFGFQSLSGLFSQATPRGRYSRPRDRQVEVPKENQQDSERPARDEKVSERPFFSQSPSTRDHENGRRMQNPDSAPVADKSERLEAEQHSSGQQARSGETDTAVRSTFTPEEPPAGKGSPEPTNKRTATSYSGRATRQGRLRAGVSTRTSRRLAPTGDAKSAHGGSAVLRKTVNGYGRVWQDTPQTRDEAQAEYVERIRTTSPFSSQPGTPAIQDTGDAVQSPIKAWGLSAKDQKTIDSISDSEGRAALEIQPNVKKPADDINKRPSPNEPTQAATKATSLTHVNASGKAHMVDVGAKTPTRRVAIATASVRFSTEETAKLILENNNKKGDVLGVARIAGLMAAKRTSDLIPLCHPIVISKAEVDLTLKPPGELKDFGNTVFIQTRVDCVGPTGVEMEALTAATGAALTVYDMCKAVDREMDIGMTRLVYKSGGRSGTYVSQPWRTQKGGSTYMRENGLEDPFAAKKRK